jgi:dihydrofolate reductase
VIDRSRNASPKGVTERDSGRDGRPTVSLIVALDRNRLIGAGGRLPWHLPADLKRFRGLTLGHHVIMGRKTWESLGRALPGRTNVVLTRQSGFPAQGARVVSCLDDALRLAAADTEVFVIGGAEIYALALPRADRTYVTEIDAAFDGDTWFPPLPANEWREVSREPQHAAPGEPGFAYVTYERVAGPARAGATLTD